MKSPIIQIMAIWIKSLSIYLIDEVRLRNFLDELVSVLGMTVIMPTVGVKLPINGNYLDFRGRKPDVEDSGYSFVVLISESHIAIHTWPKFGKAFLDIVSCKEFEEDMVSNLIKKYFPGSNITSSSLRM